MTRSELGDIIDGKRPITKRLTIALAEALVAVIDKAEDEGPGEYMGCPGCGKKNGNSFALGYATKARVVAARISGATLP
jgi:hypothetical protein